MKAEDLMIGDWVHYKMDLGKDGIYEKDIQIINIYGCEVNCELRGYEIISGKRMDNLEPIPLTPEILEKNKLDFCKIEAEFKQKDTMVIYGREAPFIILGDIAVNYVHELQHALRLCEIEKKIAI